MGVVLALVLHLLKFCIIIGFAVATQGSKGSIIFPSPIFLPVIPPGTEALGPIDHRESWGSNAPSLPSNPGRLVISSYPATLHLLPSSIETPGSSHQRGSRRTISPSYPSVPNGPFFHPPNTLPPPASAPTPQKSKDIEPSISPGPLSPPHEAIPSPPTVQGNMPPSIKASPSQRKAPVVRPPVSTPIAPAPVAIPSGRSKNSPVSQPAEHGNLAPNIDDRSANMSHTADPVFPTPAATPSTNFPNNSSRSQPTEHGSFPPKEGTNKGQSLEPISSAPVAVNMPKISPVSQPSEHGSLPPNVRQRNANTAAMPPATYKENSTVSQPTQHGSIPPYVHQRNTNKVNTPEPVSPTPATSPRSAFPVYSPLIPAVSPSKLPASVPSPMSTPSRIINPEKGREPVAAPLYKAPKPLPAVIHFPAQAPAPKKVRQSHHAPEPLTSSPKSPSNKEKLSPALTPSVSFYKHHHTRNIIIVPAPASSYMVSPPTSRRQDSATPPSLSPTGGQVHHATPPSLSPTGGQKHHAPLPLNSVSPFSSTVHSSMSRVSPAPSPSFKSDSHPAKIPFFPPKVSPSGSSSKSPRTPLLPQVQALPPPPPNEDCLSTVCREPYVTSPPGAPCRCVWPMRVGLRLSISLYTFFPLVSELASEIATEVFMKQSQVRIMGANAANQQPDKTVVLIDLVPLGAKFDYTTAFLTSDRFWHKKVVIKSSYFGEYDVLYVNYPGLPPSPPLPPSSITMIDGGPYSTDGNNGRTIKPLGVDIQKRQYSGELSRGIIAIIAVSVFLAVALCTAAASVMFKFRDHISQPASTPRLSPPSLTKAPGTVTGSSIGDGGVGSVFSSFQSSIASYTGSAKTFSMSDIEKATDNFHASRIVGEGGFGLVYSGVLGEGTKVAVKVLKREDHQGDREFLAEVEMLSRLHHRNLVKLIGICAEDSFRCLVYELIPNGSLESHLHGVDMEKFSLDWSARMKIALGAARGLAYLHEDSSPRVIHRDFKSSNILLEDDFTPKVSDFGLARTASDEENRHIPTHVMGTFGYLAPEYAMTGHLLVKSDVYSYGVVLLELLTGRKPVDMSQAPGQENLVAWARPLLTSKEGLEAIIDPSLGADVPFDSVAKVAAIASMCVQPEVSNRPFMGEVVQALKLVCNECEEAKEDAGSRSSSQEDLYIALDVGGSNISGQLSDNFQSQFSATNFDSGVDVERGLSASELFSSAKIGRVEFGSFRRNSYSGPLGTGRSRQLWQIMRRLSGGSVSEHGAMFK